MDDYEQRLKDNIDLVRQEALKFAASAACPNQAALDDLISVAAIGLLKGVHQRVRDDELVFYVRTELNNLLERKASR